MEGVPADAVEDLFGSAEGAGAAAPVRVEEPAPILWLRDRRVCSVRGGPQAVRLSRAVGRPYARSGARGLLTHDVFSPLVVSQPLHRWMAKVSIGGPFEERDFRDHFRPYPPGVPA